MDASDSSVKILLVKLSSLGDVLHNLPIVWDIRRSYPDARIDWVVEEGYVELLTPLLSNESFRGIDHIISVSARRWKKEFLRGEFKEAFREVKHFKAELQAVEYDVMIETQGLLKAAFVTRLANKSSSGLIAGIGNRTQDSGYEPLSRWFYDTSVSVPLHCHAVDRSRAVMSAALGIKELSRDLQPPQFYRKAFIAELQKNANPLDLNPKTYVMCFHATARMAKSWSPQNWIQVGNYLSEKKLSLVFPWGNTREKQVSEYLASHIPGAVVPKSFSIHEAFTLVSQAKLNIGVDTGLTHLAAILEAPTIELYVDSPRWKTEGYWSDHIVNLGDTGQPPTANQVIEKIQRVFWI